MKMNLQEWAENKVNELVNDIKFYINEGISKERAIEMVRKETAVGKVYWEKVVAQI
jgi:hypothetical protein